MKTRIIIPTYNEAENIGLLIDELRRSVPKAGILVVDDGSPDGTAAIVRARADRDPAVAILEGSGRGGMGAAYRRAFARVLGEGGDDVIVTMDADFSHSPSAVPALITAADNHDLVVGSRYVPGGRIEHWEFQRRLLSRGGNVYVRLITGLPIRDCTAGFSAMRTDFLRRVPFGEVRADGYAWWFELRSMFWRRGARITEVPITFTERRLGQSKINAHVIYEGLIEPWRIRFSRL